MKLICQHQTRVGTFYIGRDGRGMFHVIFDNESYGPYRSAEQAIDDLVNDALGSVFHPLSGELLDLSSLDIPASPADWSRMP